MNRIRTVIIGTGFGGRVILPALAAIPGVEVVAICGGKDERKTKNLASQYDIPVWNRPFQEICRSDEVDLTFIASPHEYHYSLARAAMEAGHHIVCEKPLALRDAEVAELEDRAANSGKLCLTNHQLRFHPALRQARDAICSGAIGGCYQVFADYRSNRCVNPAVEKHAWWFDPDQGGGMFWAMGTHMVDLVRFCLNRDPATARGCVAHPGLAETVCQGGRPVPVGAESMFAGILDFGDDVSAVLQATAVSFPEASSLTVVFRGDRGELRFESPGRLTLWDLDTLNGPGHALRTPKPGEHNVFETGFREFARVLGGALASDRPELLADACTFSDYGMAHRAVSALRLSAARGAWVERPPKEKNEPPGGV